MILRSPLPDFAIPNLDFSSFVLRRARQLPDKVALIDATNGERITYGAFTRAVDAAAGGLVAAGLQPGDLVAICGFNVPAYGVAAHAVWRAGGAVVTVNPLFTLGEMTQELTDAGARYLVTAPEAADRSVAAARATGVRQAWSMGGPAEGLAPFDSLQVGQQPPPEPRGNPEQDVALVLYSSGTTGLPKGVLLTHRNLMAAIYQLHSGDLAREDDVLVAISPFYHVVGLNGILNLGIYAGATVVTMVRYSTEGFLRAVQDERISSAFLTPPVVTDLTKSPLVDGFDLSSLRSILCAAAPLGPEVEAAAAQRLGCWVRQGFGMTEATGPISTVIDPTSTARGSVGPLVPNTEAWVRDIADGRELGPDEDGEILLRGPQVMKGYLNQPEATALTLEPDGWLHTGDIGHMDADGNLYIVDRLKEIIKYKAYQVAPAELEGVLLTHPAVVDVAVIPSFPDEDSGEIPKAFVVLRQDAAGTSAEDLMAHVAERVAPYKKVRAVEFVERIPKSPTGKILRRQLIEQERAARR